MDRVLSPRLVVPARDNAPSKRFRVTLGVAITHEDEEATLLKTGAETFPVPRKDDSA